jgi:hypothetical protein
MDGHAPDRGSFTFTVVTRCEGPGWPVVSLGENVDTGGSRLRQACVTWQRQAAALPINLIGDALT